MLDNGKKMLYWNLEKFVSERLRRYPNKLEKEKSVRERLKKIEVGYIKEKIVDNIVWNDAYYNLQLTNHEICHELFWNAFRGHSRLYIQMPNFIVEDKEISNNSDMWEKDGKENLITFSCTLLTLQMLDYDTMMFEAMSNQEDAEYSNAAKEYYRPYLFSYVAEINRDTYLNLCKVQFEQKSIIDTLEKKDASHVWMECTFDNKKEGISLNGYVVQSASNIKKIKMDIKIIEDQNTSAKDRKEILDAYELENTCKSDDVFIKELYNDLKSTQNEISTISVYRIGNGNCVYVENKTKDKSFFFDMGYNYRHRPNLLMKAGNYNYTSAMGEIVRRKPSFFILSHWDMDHIVGSYAAKKAFLNKKWYTPDCNDACADARRLAKYLDLKGNLVRASRENAGRMIGKIDMENVRYKVFMGEKALCDRSKPNCEGIVIKYEDTDHVVLMMGDVNYASYNKAVTNYNKTINATGAQEPLFADAKIDYLIVPHHGSQHTAYDLITDNKVIKTKAEKAIICCTDCSKENRPNTEHKKKLDDRFLHVETTEKDTNRKNCIEIQL